MAEVVNVWDVLDRVRVVLKERGVAIEQIIYSPQGWANGLCVNTKTGDIHILGDGQIIDEKGILRG